MSVAPSQRLLLDALLLSPAKAEEAWRSWRASTDLDRLDDADFHLLPSLAARMPAWIRDDPQRAILMGICRRAWSQNQVQLKLLAEAVQVLIAAGIDQVAATGPVVWGALYWPDGAIRPIGMVDLLVAPAMAGAALEALSGTGWKPLNAVPDVAGKGFPFAAGVMLQSPSGGQVRVHWRTLPNTDMSLQRPEFPPLDVLRADLGAPYTIPMEYAFVAALGGIHEDGLDWRLDALMICRQSGLDWTKVAGLLRWRSRLRLKLEELRRGCGVEFPAEVTKAAWTHGLERILADTLRVYRRLRADSA